MSKRQARPFTVEIRSSRKNSRDELPILNARPLRGSARSERWSDNHHGHGIGRATPEANGFFRSPGPPPLVTPQSFAQPAPEPITSSEKQNGNRTGRILPNLTPWIPSDGPQAQDNRRSAPRKRRAPRQALVIASPQDYSEQVSHLTKEAGVEQVRPSFAPVVVPSAEPVTFAIGHQRSSPTSRRSTRALERSWAYRIECRKAERRGNAQPAQPKRRK
jgi:hypothetical protein